MSSITNGLRAYDVKFADPGWAGSVLFGEFAFSGLLENNTAGGENSLLSVAGALSDPAVRGELLGSVTGTAADQKLIGVFDGIEVFVEAAAETEAILGKAFRYSYLRHKRGEKDRYTWIGRHLQTLASVQQASFDSDQATQTTVQRNVRLNHDIDVELARPIVCDMSGSDVLTLGTSAALGAAADLVCTVILHGMIGTETACRDFIASYTQNRPVIPLDAAEDREMFRGLRARRRRFLPGRGR